MARYPSYPTGLTPTQARVRVDFWEAVRDGLPHGAPSASARLGIAQQTICGARLRLVVLGLMPQIPPCSKLPDPAWREQIPEEFLAGSAAHEALPAVPTSEQSVHNETQVPRESVSQASGEKVEPSGHVYPEHISAADVGHPSADLEARVRELEAELAEVRHMNEWLTHSDAQEYRAGTLTLNLSDLHYHDKGHLLGVIRNLEDKVLVLLDRFQPHHFRCLLNGDTVPGRGVYRNQMLESVLPVAEQQVAAGAWRWREFRERLREHLPVEATEEYIVIKGNHDTSEGEDTCMPFVLVLRAMQIPARYVGTEWVMDLADAGGYWVLAEHGYGNSSYNPTSNKQVLESVQKVIDYAQRGYVNERAIRRLLHGHTHWLSVGLTRAGVRYDTTGGGHRNDRANIGRNQRPPGWIVYVSPPGANDILTPIEVTPDPHVLRQDVDDPLLSERNREEAARCLKAWHAWAMEQGILGDARSAA